MTFVAKANHAGLGGVSYKYPLASGRRHECSSAALSTTLNVVEPRACVVNWDGLAGPDLELRKAASLCTLEGCAIQVVLVLLGHATSPPPRRELKHHMTTEEQHSLNEGGGALYPVSPQGWAPPAPEGVNSSSRIPRESWCKFQAGAARTRCAYNTTCASENPSLSKGVQASSIDTCECK